MSQLAMDNIEFDDIRLGSLLSLLSEGLVKILKCTIMKQFRTEIDSLKMEINKKYELMVRLGSEVNVVMNNVKKLESHIDRMDASIIHSGPSIPPEIPNESPTNKVIETII